MRELRLCVIILVFMYFFYSGFSEPQRGLDVIPERAEIIYSNDKYVTNNSVNVRRYSRRGSYVVNFWGIIKHTWANNVTIDVILYEFLHNEYKRSFVEFHFKLCDLINKDEYIGLSLRQRGLKCPMAKGYAGVTNATMTLPKFPYVFPFERCKAEVIFKTEPSHDVIGKGHLFINFKQVPLNKVKMA